MTLSQIQATIYDTFGLAGTTDTTTVARILRYINLTHHRILGMKGIGPRLRRSLQTFSTVANSPFATLPQSVVRFFLITDRTNNNPLTEMSLGDMRYNDPGLRALASIPYAYTIYNLRDVVTQDPSAAGQLTAVSDAAGDTGATPSIYWEVIRTGGYWKAGSTNLNGITPVNIGPADTIQVRKLYLKTAPVGNVTVSDAAANVLTVIPIGHTSAHYTRLHLYPTPTGVITLYADTELHIEELANPNDESFLPEDFDDALVHGAQAREYRKRDKSELAGIETSEMNRTIAEMRIWMNSPTGVAQGNRSRPRRFSQLGGYYPNGS